MKLRKQEYKLFMNFKVLLIIIIYISIIFLPLFFVSIHFIRFNIENDINIINKLSNGDSIVEQWNHTWGGSGNDYGGEVAVDSSNNVYIIGYTENFGAGNYDLFLVKYNSNGIQQWYRTWGGANGETGTDLVIDSVDNIYITGYTSSFGEGDRDVFLVKYDSTGILQWNCIWGGSDHDEGHGIALDSSDNVYITGKIINYNTGESNLFLVKYNNAGILQWDQVWGGSEQDIGLKITVDSSDNLYITGYTTSFGAGYYDVILVKYDDSGTQQWYRTWGGSGYDTGYGITVDSSDNVYITGVTENFGAAGYDTILVKYNSGGIQQWYRTWGESGYEYGYGITIDSDHDIYIIGYTTSFGVGYRDVYFMKYDDSGTQQWYRTWGGSDYDNGYGIAVDSSNNVYIAGYTKSFGAGNYDIFLVKYGLDLDNDNDGLSDEEEVNFYSTDPNDPDSDDDDLNDGEEINSYFTNPNDPDSDDDDLNDGEEVNSYFTNPNDPDSDDDYLNDGEEVNSYFTNPNDPDSDDDDLNDGEEINSYFTNPNDPDSDDDNLNDGAEIKTYFTDPNDLDSDDDNLNDGAEIKTYFTDPNDPDSDDDNLNDGAEIKTYSTDPNDPDSDDDDLNDWEEINTYSTDPNDPDSDDDDLNDWEEINTYSTDPNNPDSDDDDLNDWEEINTYSTDPNDPDSDDDLMPDGWEVSYKLNPLIDDSSGDPDKDNLSNLEEYTYSTDPNDPDSDNDGYSDYNEIFKHHTDPNNFFSSPLTIPVILGIVCGIIFIGIVLFMATVGKRKIRDFSYFMKLKKDKQKRKTEELLEQFKKIDKLIEEKDYLMAIEDLNEILNKIKKENLSSVAKIAKKKLKDCKLLQIDYNKELEAKTFEGLLRKALELVKVGKKAYSKQSYSRALDYWNDSISMYDQALVNATTPENKSKIKEILKSQKVIRKDILNTYIRNGETYESIGKDNFKKNKFSKVLNNLENAKLNYETAINFINSNDLKESIKDIKDRISNVDFNIVKVKLNQNIYEIDKIVKNSHSIQDEQLTEAKKIIEDSLIRYKDLSNTAGRYPELKTKLENRIKAVNSFKMKLEEKFQSLIEITPSTERSSFQPLQEPEYGKILNAKIVFIGPEGVGKTSLIRYIMGKEFSNFEPSTTGLDIFYKKIETTIKDYESQLCFWDLSGQPNLSTFNEINIHDACIIILVFNITNPQTFKDLKKTYLGMVKNARKFKKNFLFLVGNKIDLGGRAILQKEIDQFINKNDIYKFCETSASTGENMDDLIGSIRQAINWSEMVKNIKPEILNIVGKEIKKLRAHEKIMEMSEFMSIFVEQSYQLNKIEIQAAIKKYASQDLILLGRTGRFIVLDPEFIAKMELELSKIAAYNNGKLNRDDYLKKWKLTRTQLKRVFEFLEEEKYCYRVSKRVWVFSNVPRYRDVTIDAYTQNILDSDTKTSAYKIQDSDEFIFNRLILNLIKEFGPPEQGGGFFVELSALWRIGKPPDLSVLFINYMPSKDGCVIRLKVGGGKGEDILKKIEELAFLVFTSYAPKFEKIKFIEEYP